MSVVSPRRIIPKSLSSVSSGFNSYIIKNSEKYLNSDLINKFLEIKSFKQDKIYKKDQILHNVLSILSNLDVEEIKFALKIVEFIESKKLEEGQKGGAGETIEFENINGKVSVKMTSRNNFLYYILNIFVVLITYALISSLFQNTIIMQTELIQNEFALIRNEVSDPSREAAIMNTYIQRLAELNNNAVIHTIDAVKPLIMEGKPFIIEGEITGEKGILVSLSDLYGLLKGYLNFDVNNHFPDMINLHNIYEGSKAQLQGLTSSQSLVKSIANSLLNIDNTQQKIIILQQIVNLFPTLIASYSLKMSKVLGATASIKSLIHGMFYRLLIMFAISKCFHKQGNAVITLLTDTTKTLPLQEFKDMIETEENDQIKQIFDTLNYILQGSNLSIVDKKMITEEIEMNIDSFSTTPNVKAAVKAAVDEAVKKLPDSDISLLENRAANGGKPRRQTRRKIRRNKKAKTKKRKKTKKKKMKTKKSKRKTNKRRTKK